MAAIEDLMGVTTKHLEELISCPTAELQALADEELIAKFQDIFNLEPPIVIEEDDEDEESIIETVTNPAAATAKKAKRLSAKERKLKEIEEFKALLIQMESEGIKPTNQQPNATTNPSTNPPTQQ